VSATPKLQNQIEKCGRPSEAEAAFLLQSDGTICLLPRDAGHRILTYKKSGSCSTDFCWRML
jgi:hypothetical protein